MRNTLLICLIVIGISIAFPVASHSKKSEKSWDYYAQGEFALRVHKWDRAIELFTKALKHDPKNALSYRNRAIAYSKKGRYDECIADLKQAAKLEPKSSEIYGLMGVVYEIQQDYESALRVYQKALSLERRPPAIRSLKKWIADMKKKVRSGK